MDTFPKFLASAFVVIVAVFIALSLIISGVSVVSAKSFYSNVADSIGAMDAEHEDFMIEECKVLAQENGYTLHVEKKDTGDNGYYYELKLEYSFVAPFFSQINTGTVSGYVYPGAYVRVSR